MRMRDAGCARPASNQQQTATNCTPRAHRRRRSWPAARARATPAECAVALGVGDAQHTRRRARTSAPRACRTHDRRARCAIAAAPPAARRQRLRRSARSAINRTTVARRQKRSRLEQPCVLASMPRAAVDQRVPTACFACNSSSSSSSSSSVSERSNTTDNHGTRRNCVLSMRMRRRCRGVRRAPAIVPQCVEQILLDTHGEPNDVQQHVAAAEVELERAIVELGPPATRQRFERATRNNSGTTAARAAAAPPVPNRASARRRPAAPWATASTR